MRALRLLIGLLVALTLSAPPVLAASGPASVHTAGDCSHHDKEKGKAALVNVCCTASMMPAPIVAAGPVRGADFHRAVRPAFRLRGIIVGRDPPPPRV
jgi:hypothetical protein